MCGIVCVFAYRDSAPPVDPAEVERVNAAMFRRGPDDGGFWLSEDRRVGMGSRRLAILDISPGGHQPMRSANGRYTIVYNGEIYNFREIRSRLERDGVEFVSESDTEVLLALFERAGPAMLDEIRGMFALCIWDARDRRLFIARDPFGIKPLYVADDGATLRIGSQVRALIAGGQVSRAIEPAAACGFFALGSIPEPFTLRKAIRAFPAGSYAWVDGRGLAVPKRVFSVASTYHAPAVDPRTALTDQQSIVEAVRDSVRAHLVSDVPVGAFLSAGIDSGAITGAARDAGAAIRTITVSFDAFEGRAEHEAPRAERVAALYGTDHTTARVTRSDFDASLPRILEDMDQPTIDGINTWFVSRAAAAAGLKVALSGVGGDELFGSYPSFRQIPRLVRAMQGSANLRPLGVGSRRILSRLLPAGSPRQKLAGILEYGGTWSGAWLLRRGLYMPWELGAILPSAVVEEGMDRLGLESLISSAIDPDPGTPHGRIASLESSLYMRNQLLRDTDWASMAHSLEVRVPLVDRVLLETIAPIVAAGTYGAKGDLARVPRVPLPSEITRHPKLGFSVPLASWLETRHRDAGTGSRSWAHLVWEHVA